MGNVDLGTFATEQSKADSKFTTNAIKSCMKTIIITCEIFKFKKILIPVSYHVHTPSLKNYINDYILMRLISCWILFQCNIG